MTTQTLGKGRPCTTFTAREEAALKGRLGCIPLLVVEFLRVSIDGHHLHSIHYVRPKKTCNSLFLGKDGHYYILERIYDLGTGSIVLCCQRLLCHKHTRVLHLTTCVANDHHLRILNTDEVHRICVSMKIDGLHYVSAIPNMFEQD